MAAVILFGRVSWFLEVILASTEDLAQSKESLLWHTPERGVSVGRQPTRVPQNSPPGWLIQWRSPPANTAHSTVTPETSCVTSSFDSGVPPCAAISPSVNGPGSGTI